MIKIGPHVLANPLILAPMAGVTDRPFRNLCKKLGAGLTVSEMVGSRSLIEGSHKTLLRANHEGEPGLRSVQIVGACPKTMGEAAKINQDLGAEIIDINMGCPAKKVCNMLSGSALMPNEELVKKILTSVVKAVEIPVTLKIRTGWSNENKNAPNIAKIAEDVGIQAIAIHGRTRSCFFRGEAEYDTIALIKSQRKIPIFANGDIDSPQKAKFVLNYTKADGLLIGRAAQGAPWIFNQINHYLSNNTELTEPSRELIGNYLMEHLEELYEFYGEEIGVKIARKHVSWYAKGQRNATHFRNEFNLIQTAELQKQIIKQFFYSNANDI